MARHFITERTAIRPGVIHTVCTCGQDWTLPAREIDAVVNEHLGQVDDNERVTESDTDRLKRINRWVHAAGHEYGTLIDDIVGIHSAKGPDGKVQILGLTDVTWLLVHAKSALQCEVSRHDLARIIQSHVFRASRPWPDGTQPTAPDWNPGCSCGEGMYWSQWDLHVADQILAATTSESNER